MAKNIKKIEAKTNKNGSTQRVIAGITGAFLGALIGGVAGVSFADEKIRRKMGKAIDAFTEQATETVDVVSKNTNNIRDAKDTILDTLDMK